MTVSYTHRTNQRSKHMRLRIEGDGAIIVTTPPRTPTHLIEKFITTNTPWISKQQAKLALKPRLHTPEQVTIFGKVYKKVIKYSAQLPVGVGVLQNEVAYNPTDPQKKPEEQQQAFQTALNRYLKNTAQHYILERTKLLAQTMGITYKKVTIRKQKTRWGSCSSAGNLNFNWQLVHFPPKMIDYVIVHELAHRKHMNHSAAFWEVVRRFCPDYKAHRAWIQRHGYTVG